MAFERNISEPKARVPGFDVSLADTAS